MKLSNIRLSLHTSTTLKLSLADFTSRAGSSSQVVLLSTEDMSAGEMSLPTTVLLFGVLSSTSLSDRTRFPGLLTSFLFREFFFFLVDFLVRLYVFGTSAGNLHLNLKTLYNAPLYFYGNLKF